jgi:rRNA maturation protein Rpf1
VFIKYAKCQQLSATEESDDEIDERTPVVIISEASGNPDCLTPV